MLTQSGTEKLMETLTASGIGPVINVPEQLLQKPPITVIKKSMTRFLTLTCMRDHITPKLASPKILF